jgi:hypothetical protein
MLTFYLILVLVLSGCADRVDRADWQPPRFPIPQWILLTAKNDAEGQRYQMALAKHIWLFKNSAKIDPSMAGVRLSFALADWRELADEYPPAMKALVAARDEALDSVRTGSDSFSAFNDYASINEYLEQQEQTTEAFIMLNESNPLVARQVFNLALPALIRSKKYDVCGLYLNSQHLLDRSVRLYRMGSSGFTGFMTRNYAEDKLTNDVGNLVGLLVMNHRSEEAEEVARQAKTVRTDSVYYAVIDSALKGIMPAPWP